GPIHAEGHAGHPRRVRPARIQPGHEPGARRRGRHRRPPPPACRAAVGRGRELPARGRPDQGPAASARRCAGAAVERMEPMNPEDLDTLAEYSTPKLRGDEAVISIRRPDLESNRYLSQLFALGSDRSRRLTHACHDSDPQIHPNWSGFLRAERKAAAQLYIGSTLETAHQITDNHLGVSEFAIDDAGARALYVARVAEPGRYGLDDVPAAEEAPRRITTSAYLSNGLGYTDDRPARAFLVDLAEPGLGKVGLRAASEVPLSTLLSTPDCDVHDPQFSPAGTRASVVAALHPDRGRPDLRSTVWLLGGDTAEPLDLPSMDVSRHLWLDEDTVVLVGIALTRD